MKCCCPGSCMTSGRAWGAITPRSVPIWRPRYSGEPALAPPLSRSCAKLSAITFWHGKLLNDWAGDWVRFWTQGKGVFVTSAEEDSGTAQALEYLHRTGRVDKERLLVLRAGWKLAPRVWLPRKCRSRAKMAAKA